MKFFVELATAFWNADETVKQKKLADVKKDVVPFILDKLDAVAEENNGFMALGRVWMHCNHFSILHVQVKFN